jgi:predicted anti-sigma-YlaC factor YlaD
MNCDEANELINLFVDGELPTPNHDPLFKHLSDCSECRLFFKGILRLREIEQKEQIAYPAELDNSIFSTIGISTKLNNAPIWRRSFRLSFPLAAAALIVVVLLGAILGNLLFPGNRSRAAKQNVGYAYQETDKLKVLDSLPPVRVFPASAHGSNSTQK